MAKPHRITTSAKDPTRQLPAPFRDWFVDRGWSLRPHQLDMIDKAKAGADVLLVAPTGGGKTLAGFLPSLLQLAERGPRKGRKTLHTLYISPLKALAVDVERNLLTPVRDMDLPILVESRTGDTGQARRQRQRTSPPDILLTTPEQLALFCAWKGARDYFQDLECVIIDEIHAIHGSKRGDLLSLGLARLRTFAPGVRCVGLSATVDDPARVRRWLSDRGDDIVLGQAGAPPRLEVLLSQNRVPWAGHTAQHAMAEVYETIKTARTTLVFVNTRWQAEFAFQELWRLNDDNLPIALHHGSLSAEQRRKVEAAMSRHELRAVVCTSTLDLGIDWGAVDLVIQLAAPKGASRLVQRIGRANHRLDEASRAILVPASRFEMLECQAAAEAVAENALDGDLPRTGARDVLAQHVMGCACSEPFDLVDLYDEVRRAAPYAGLSWEAFEQVVDFVSTGGYALRNYDRFRRIIRGPDGRWRVLNEETARRHRMNVGVIVAAQTLNIRLAGRRGAGRKIGQAEEWYFEQLTPGDSFLFAGEIWRFEGVRATDAIVTRSNDKQPKVPSWGGSRFALSTFLAKRVRRMISDQASWSRLPPDVCEWLFAQQSHSSIPGEEDLLVETFRRGKRHYMVCYPFEGRLAHATLAMLITRRLDRAGVGPIGYLANDYALCVWSLRPMDSLDFDALFQQDMLGDDLEAWLDESFMVRRAFKECALISGLIERRMPGHEKNGRQVTFSADLIYDTLRRHDPDHLLLSCAREDAARGLLDLARLGEFLTRISGRIGVERLQHVSPFAVPLLMEIGKERAPGTTAADMMLEDAALIDEAMS
ncbi:MULTISPECIES: ligase-associated DNA damage response DEXH box helicase [unclassified Brevundimonas]|uniref:ligase-associated DNA damage response DEXH box helicase n=1 Tax=unclassified Brevundimonas TaxID=2622653 RepID=UPI000CFDA5CB|nr:MULTISPECIES: ligase-associated DNA damage response DEXH box helicase [unclassified Brevundimonas]PRA28566.1 DNA ligase-associated DEXH box helicase [Brevundimonas sp. MYb27]PQZ84089.1 DNA ligase-associated DEXH box helicase [Brevundimonas sp. MYb31]PRB17938.1 DNA ligase-associated DEXH box helicase [Brevundimonas sp. MYb52]PRB35918.1 DNA ligase-associated DEXH box helicase [Brevundimonas sp. MYb46]PRB55910.1 DNA ligase-associated DEXH box helicase [Brevundimonas sp. MYb33]